jgi:hypothetical protein
VIDVEVTLREALGMAEQLGDADIVARVGFFLGGTLLSQGRFDEGRTVLLAARDHFHARGNVEAWAWCEHELGWERMLQGDHAGARECFERAVGVIAEPHPERGAGERFLTVHLWAGLALAGAVNGSREMAQHLSARAVGAARDLPMRGFLVMALCRATEVGTLIDDDAMAAEALDELLITLRELGAWRWVADALEATVSLLPPGDAEGAAVEARLLGAAD